jgi:hypothetical protein
MSYTDFKLVGVKQTDGDVVCMLTQADGRGQEVHLSELVAYPTYVLVNFAMSLEITVPGFVVLLALARVGWYKRTVRVSA